MEQNWRINVDAREAVDREKYQRLVGRLIYLCHAHPNITYAMSIVSQYMHDLRAWHMEAIYQILG